MLLLLALPGFAQDSAGLGWSIALGGRFRELRDPVASVHAPAESATLICPSDRGAAGALFFSPRGRSPDSRSESICHHRRVALGNATATTTPKASLRDYCLASPPLPRRCARRWVRPRAATTDCAGYPRSGTRVMAHSSLACA